jgi:hypothetical protein
LPCSTQALQVCGSRAWKKGWSRKPPTGDERPDEGEEDVAPDHAPVIATFDL